MEVALSRYIGQVTSVSTASYNDLLVYCGCGGVLQVFVVSSGDYIASHVIFEGNWIHKIVVCPTSTTSSTTISSSLLIIFGANLLSIYKAQYDRTTHSHAIELVKQFQFVEWILDAFLVPQDIVSSLLPSRVNSQASEQQIVAVGLAVN
jgi:hypothetical protein